MCDVRNQTKDDAVHEIGWLTQHVPPGYTIDDQVATMGDDERLLSLGSHCWTFITPNLVIESLPQTPHNLVSWENFFASTIKDDSELAYFSIDAHKVLTSAAATLRSVPHLTELLELKRAYRDWIEHAPVPSAQSAGHTRLGIYELMAHPPIRQRLLDFFSTPEWLALSTREPFRTYDPVKQNDLMMEQWKTTDPVYWPYYNMLMERNLLR